MQKSLDQKLARILQDPSSKDFILADAKDADMAFGLAAPGKSPEHHAQRGPLPHAGRVPPTDARDRRPGAGRHHAHERQHQRGAHDRRSGCSTTATSRRPSGPTTRRTSGWPRARAATARSRRGRSAPPRSTTSCAARPSASPSERGLGADLGLYSVTFNNDVELDHRVAGSLQGVPPRGRGQGLSALPRSLRSQRLRRAPAGRRRPVHQRPHRPGAGRRDAAAAGRCS